MEKQKLFIFDMGNTLLDFHSGIHTDEEKDELGLSHMSKLLFEKYKIDISANRLRLEFLTPWFQDFYKREKLIELDVEDYLRSVMGPDVEKFMKQDYVDLMRSYYKEYMNEVVVYEGVKELFIKLKELNIKIAILSNCILYDEIYIEVFDRLGLTPYIDQFFFSYSRKIRKPDLRIFKEVLDWFSVSGSEATMVGDNIKADLVPSRALGIHTVWINRKEKQDAFEMVDCQVKSLKELQRVVLRV